VSEPTVSTPIDAADEPDAAAAGHPGLAAERDRLARTLRETRLQLAMTQARLSALEQSATMELGRTLVRVARRPWSRGVQLPADLVRLWRERGGLTGPERPRSRWRPPSSATWPTAGSGSCPR